MAPRVVVFEAGRAPPEHEFIRREVTLHADALPEGRARVVDCDVFLVLGALEVSFCF